jgi:tryptophan synthase alpha chain
VSFITAADPGPQYTVAALHALVAGGVDLLELGIPFSDPEAEGPAIQAANERALAQGITLVQVLAMVEEFRRQDAETPVVLMGYLNSILAMDNFAEHAANAGVDGLIMVNLPPEEGDRLQQQLADHNIDLIYLLAPTTTDERAQQIAAKASGFIYYVSLKGITGASHLQTDEVAARLQQLRDYTTLPFCVGFGIKDAATANALAPHADGVVVGSALVNSMAAGGEVAEVAARLQQQAADIRQGIDAADQ